MAALGAPKVIPESIVSTIITKIDYLDSRSCQLFLHRETVDYLTKKKTRFYDRNTLINKD